MSGKVESISLEEAGSVVVTTFSDGRRPKTRWGTVTKSSINRIKKIGTPTRWGHIALKSGNDETCHCRSCRAIRQTIKT